MKKRTFVLLCLCVMLILFGCKPEQTARQDTVLQVGYGRADITPDFKMPLQGYPGPEGRIFTRVLDPIYATCIALFDGEKTVLLFQLDLTDNCWEAVNLAKGDIVKATGVPYGNIMAAVTHNHSSPSFTEWPLRERYMDLMRRQMLAAAQDAIGDLLPAQMYTGSIEAEGLNAVRHYTLSDGTYAGDNFGNTEGTSYTGHVGKADKQLQVLRFARSGGKDVVLANWQAHPHMTGGQDLTDLSSDIVGPMTTYVEEALDCHFAYFTGAAGNLNSQSRIPSENSAQDYVEHGTELGRYVQLAYAGMTPVAVGPLQLLEEKYAPVSRTNGKEGAELRLNALSVGDVGFVFVPYEMFSQSGEFIKENSPFLQTFIVGYANASSCYMPVEFAYTYDAYEVTLCPYEAGSAEKLAQKYVDMLTELFATRGAGTAPPLNARAKVFWNVDRGSVRTAEPDGGFRARFLQDGKLVTLTVPAELMAEADKQDILGMVTDGDRVTAVISLADMPQSLLCQDYCVQNISGSTIKVNVNRRLTGKSLVLKLKDVPVLDVSDLAGEPGEAVALQCSDLVTALLDENGDLVCVFLTRREGIYTTSKRYCDHCNGEVDFINWFSATSLPVTSGHYYLEKDVTLNDTQTIGTADVTVDLNGKTVIQIVEGQLVYHMKSGANLTILDSVGTSVVYPASTSADQIHEFKKGLCVRMESGAKVLNVYGGTYDGSKAVAQHSTTFDNMDGTMNIYGGTFIGGSTYCAGAATIMVQGRTNIYGGTFIGGHAAEGSMATATTKGGGNLFVTVGAVCSIYGGTFEGGVSDYDGGNILNHAELRLYGGTITGGKAAGVGDTLYSSAQSILIIDGDVQITGTVYLDEEATLEVGGNCKRSVIRSKDGTLTVR